MPKTAGIWNLVLGGLLVVFGLAFLISGIVSCGLGLLYMEAEIAFASVLIGMSSIIADIYAVKRKGFRAALIFSVFGFLPYLRMSAFLLPL